MKPHHYRRLWRILVPVTLALTLDTWSAAQNGPALFGSAIIDAQSRSLMLIVAIVFLSALVIALGMILRGHAASVRPGTRLWSARIPDLLLDDADPRDPPVRRLRLATLAAVLLLPLAAMVHFHLELSEGRTTCPGGAPAPYDLTAWSHLGVNDPCRIIDADAEPDDDGVTWFPVFQPALLLLLTGLAALSAARVPRALKR